MAAHTVAVTFAGGRYPFVPVCSCGWTTWGYVAAHAAQNMADAHEEESCPTNPARTTQPAPSA